MPTINEQILAAFPLKEGMELEYKSAKGGFPQSFWETFSAFANSNGWNPMPTLCERVQPDRVEATLLVPFVEENVVKDGLQEENVVKDVVKEKNVLKEGPQRENVLNDVLKDVLINVLKELTERQRFIVELISEDPSLSAKAISEKISEKASEKTSVSDRTIENDIAQLKQRGILTREGGRKEGRWVIILPNTTTT